MLIHFSSHVRNCKLILISWKKKLKITSIVRVQTNIYNWYVRERDGTTRTIKRPGLNFRDKTQNSSPQIRTKNYKLGVLKHLTSPSAQFMIIYRCNQTWVKEKKVWNKNCKVSNFLRPAMQFLVFFMFYNHLEVLAHTSQFFKSDRYKRYAFVSSIRVFSIPARKIVNLVYTF